MKKIFIIFIGLFCCHNGFAQNNDAETLKKLNADWIASYVTKDTVTMSRIFADDLVLTNPAGKIFYKQDILKGVMSPGQQFISSKVDTVSVRLLGTNVGVINAQVTGTVKANGETSTFRTNYMDVYEKRHGRWYAVAAHVTLLPLPTFAPR
jgi:ketosteroid isomerase-like protein